MDLDRTLDHAASAAPLLPIDIDVTAGRRLARLEVAGDLDGSTTTELLGAVRKVLAAPAPERVELHLAALTFIDSAGIRCLLTCQTAAEDAGSRLLLVNPSRPVFRVLEITSLLDHFGLAVHAGSGTGTPRGPHRAPSLPELFDQSATLRQNARDACARAQAARRVGLLTRLRPEPPAQ
jgi:anti-anti-sigma factor